MRNDEGFARKDAEARIFHAEAPSSWIASRESTLLTKTRRTERKKTAGEKEGEAI